MFFILLSSSWAQLAYILFECHRGKLKATEYMFWSLCCHGGPKVFMVVGSHMFWWWSYRCLWWSHMSWWWYVLMIGVICVYDRSYVLMMICVDGWGYRCLWWGHMCWWWYVLMIGTIGVMMGPYVLMMICVDGWGYVCLWWGYMCWWLYVLMFGAIDVYDGAICVDDMCWWLGLCVFMMGPYVFMRIGVDG